MTQEIDAKSEAFRFSFPDQVWATAAERLSQVARVYGPSTRNRVAAAQTLGITLTCVPFEEREVVLRIALALVGIMPGDVDQEFNVGTTEFPSPVTTREALLQLADRERTYLSNVPAHTPMARISRLLIQRGILYRIASDLDPIDLRRRVLAIEIENGADERPSKF